MIHVRLIVNYSKEGERSLIKGISRNFSLQMTIAMKIIPE
jgi:hypothetical protein